MSNGFCASSAWQRAISASRLATCALSAPTSAVVKVGSSVASTSPCLTTCPSCTSSDLMIDWSSAPSTTVGSIVTICPAVEVMTRSTRIVTVISARHKNNPASMGSVIRAWTGSGPERISAVSDWKMRTSRSAPGLGAARRAERNNFMRRPGQEVLVLLVPKIAVDVAALDQRCVRTDVVDPPAFEHEDRIGRDQRGQPVRNDDQRAALGDAHQIGVDDRLALGVERARRLVEDQDPRVGDQRAGDRQPLPLTARQIGRAFVDEGVVAALQPLDEFLGPGEPGRHDDLVKAGIRLARGDRVADRAAEQKILLHHDAKTAAQMIDVVLPQIGAVDLDQTLVIAVEQLQQPGHRGLAGAAAPHD